MDVETTFHAPYSSPFEFGGYPSSGPSHGTQSPYSTAINGGAGSARPGSRLLEFTPDTHSSIWSAESKEANHEAPGKDAGAAGTTAAAAAALLSASLLSPSSASPAAATGSTGDMMKETEKSMAASPVATGAPLNAGRDSSSPPNSAGGSLGTCSVASSLDTGSGGLGDLSGNASLFGDSVWSSTSKGSFHELGSFGSTEEERRFLMENKGAGFLKPPPVTGNGSTPGSNTSSSAGGTWGSFWSDLSPSLSPSNSESNLQQHFGSPVNANAIQPQSGNPFSTWNPNGVSSRRSGPQSPFSSGSASPISRKQQLSPPGIGLYPQQQPQQFRAGYNGNHNGINQQQQPNGGFSNQHAMRHHQQYRRSVSHPNNGHLLHHNNNNNNSNHHHHHHHPAGQNHFYGQMNGSNNGFDGTGVTSNGFYGGGHNHGGQQHSQGGSNHNNGDSASAAFCGGWNMEPAMPINGYHPVRKTLFFLDHTIIIECAFQKGYDSASVFLL